MTTSNLIAAFTVLDPGDRARPHRHTFAAIRFATRAEGAATIVNGRRCDMHDGDLILTPPMCWHGHINDSDHRIIWFDAANIPLIRQLDANFFEPGDPKANQFWQVDEGEEKLWAESGLVGADVQHAPAHSPKYRYSGEATRRLLAAAARRPRRRAHASATPIRRPAARSCPRSTAMRCGCRKGQPTRPKRTTCNMICLVVSGSGRSTVGEHTFEWSQHDVFTIPHWTLASHEAQRRRRRPVHRLRQVGVRAARPAARGTAINPRAKISGEGIGASVRRVEDPKFLRGQGRYVADIALPGELHCVLVRSPHAHARIRRIDSAKAAAPPGVVAVFTGADMAADKVGPMAPLWAIRTADGKPMAEPPRWALARDTVRHVGEPVAAVIAETRDAGAGCGRALEVDYEPLPAVDRRPRRDGRRRAATARRGARQYLLSLRAGRRSRGAQGVRRRGARGAARPRQQPPDRRRDRAARGAGRRRRADKLTLYASTQVPHHIRRTVTEQLGLPQTAIRLVAPDVGGGFGYKGKHYPEETIIAWAARRLRRPVKWVATRSESFVSDYQGRGHQTRAELALDARGAFPGAARRHAWPIIGAYVSTFGAGIPSAIYSALLAGVYRTPAIFVQSTGVFTNTVPTDAYRGAGRPEACYVLERLADEAARELGDRPRRDPPAQSRSGRGDALQDADRADLRLRQFSQGVLARCWRSPTIKGFAQAPQAAARAARKLRGFGIACYVESSGVAPSRLPAALGARVGFFEAAQIRVQPDGSVQALLGTHNHGQGHATTLRADHLRRGSACRWQASRSSKATPIRCRTARARSARAPSRSAARRSTAPPMKIIDKGKQIAAHLLEASAGDIAFRRRRLHRRRHRPARDASREVARVAHHAAPTIPLETSSRACRNARSTIRRTSPSATAPTPARSRSIRETGEIASRRLLGRRRRRHRDQSDDRRGPDPGRHRAGARPGAARALRLRRRTASCCPARSWTTRCRAPTTCPPIVAELDESQPCTHNPLGAKGCGEAGSIGAPAAIVGAVLDALPPLGVTDIEMPLTPEAVWRAIASARPTGASR